MVNNSETALLILAAGNSSRMGEPKQLLPWKNTTLLGNVINEGKASGIKDIYVVLGAFCDKITEVISAEEVFIIKNPEWEKGMATSIATGIKEIQLSDKNYQQILIALCDQPLITTEFFCKLIDTLDNNDLKAAATCYGPSLGVPAVFKTPVFDKLIKLKGTSGAKGLLQSLGKKVKCVKAPFITVDVDTPEAYSKLVKSVANSSDESNFHKF